MTDYKYIKDNWDKYLLETELRRMNENNNLTEANLKKMAQKAGITVATLITLLGSMGISPEAVAAAPEREVPVAAAETEASEALNDINAALGFIQAYVGNKSSMRDRAEAEQDLMMVQKALAQGRKAGGKVDRSSLGEKDQKLLDTVMKKVNQIQERDLELYDHYKDIGTRITID